MEEELMLMIKNDLCEMKHNGFKIDDIKVQSDYDNFVVTYKYNNELFIISSNRVD